MNKELTFIIGASFTIGNYVLPSFLNEIKEAINNDVLIQVGLSQEVLDKLLDKKIDIAMVESPIFVDGVIYREWLEDEFVLFSNQPLPKVVRPEQLKEFHWICREEESHTRRVIAEAFEEAGIECKAFDIATTVSSPTAVVQTVLRAPKDEGQTVSIISKYTIEAELESGQLYAAKIKGLEFKRAFYLAYLKERKHDAFIDKVISFFMRKRKI